MSSVETDSLDSLMQVVFGCLATMVSEEGKARAGRAALGQGCSSKERSRVGAVVLSILGGSCVEGEVQPCGWCA